MVSQNQQYISGLMWLLMELIDKLVGLPEKFQVGGYLIGFIVPVFLVEIFWSPEWHFQHYQAWFIFLYNNAHNLWAMVYKGWKWKLRISEGLCQEDQSCGCGWYHYMSYNEHICKSLPLPISCLVMRLLIYLLVLRLPWVWGKNQFDIHFQSI